jgi:simple sugar transport system permease protein
MLYFFFSKTTLGYKIKAVGSSRKVAHYGGIGVGKTMLIAILLSGGFAGLAGMVEVSGVYHSMQMGISPGYGYSGILVALLGKLHPLGIVLSSILFGALIIGVDTMARKLGLSIFLSLVIQALIILTLLASEYAKGHHFTFLNRFRRES